MKRIIDVLWLSMMAPYDTVSHAGGQTENYYLKKLANNRDISMRMLTLCKPEEVDRLDFEKYCIENDYYIRPRKGLKGNALRVYSWISKCFLWNKYIGFTPWDIHYGMLSLLRKNKDSIYPSIIIIQWTEILFLLDEIKKIWPNAIIIAIEEDLSFLGLNRKRDNCKSLISKIFFSIKGAGVEKKEIKLLNCSDFVIFSNRKDYDLARQRGLATECWAWTAFYHLFECKKTEQRTNKIVFYGAMFREENWKSAIWFIKNVMPLLEEIPVRLEIIGSRPNNKLFKYQNSRVVIRGYVENVGEELNEAMCMVAPLLFGAGIKVKVLEAMSLGLPVLTNNIGIEGIPATNRIHYLKCDSAEDYASAIRRLYKNDVDINTMAIKAKELIRQNFNYEKDADEFIGIIMKLLGRVNG
ncbi:glycosyltransferase [Butyrivibrio fibrisolvens]|uniref:glycosyltransferase n=1 Tax=Butyrivibrio fibrisolvens TaxID=831 RepID=UPI0003B7490E|nr:glycosyltransferase [Butyrivibrio fibrisolvens]